MPLKAGTVLDLTGSVAQAMEQAFAEQWPLVMGDRELPAQNPHLRLLFVAIAQGVVRHLQAHPDAFKVRVILPGVGTADGEVTEIQ